MGEWLYRTGGSNPPLTATVGTAVSRRLTAVFVFLHEERLLAEGP